MRLLLDITQNMATIALLAYILSRYSIFDKALTNQINNREKIILSFIFGGFSILGNYLGVPILEGALANSRIVGPVVGGLLAGPYVGIAAGIIGGIHRTFLGGFTVTASFIANIIAGAIGGYFYKKYGPLKITPFVAFKAGVLAEIVLKSLVLLISKPFEAALALQKIIGLPTLLINSLSIALFVLIIKDVRLMQHLAAAVYAEKALRIAKRTSTVLDNGLNDNSAAQTAEIIYEITELEGISITNDTKVLAHLGLGEEHYKRGSPILLGMTGEALRKKELIVAKSRGEVKSLLSHCSIEAGVTAPFTCQGKVVGTVSLFSSDIINSTDIKLAEGISELLSMQLENAKIAEQERKLKRTEYDMLRAQINPHFLFNTLSIIKALCRTEPDKAQDLLVSLAKFFRRTLQPVDDLIPFSKELEGLEDYLNIEKSRFGSRLEITMDIEDDVYECLFPVFTLQPIIENALRHGIFPKKGKGKLEIRGMVIGEKIKIQVIDDGVGMADQVLEAITNKQVISTMGIGLTNVRQRLYGLYGEQSMLNIESGSKGTMVELIVPAQPLVDEGESSNCS